MKNDQYINRFLLQMNQALEQVSRPDIDAAIELLFQTWHRGGTVFIAGNGGSASTASHFACDLAKWTICEGKSRFRVMALTDNMPLFSALMNDEGTASVYSEQLAPFIGAGDLLILISVHGGSGEGNAGSWSQNLLRALSLARERGADCLGFSGFDGGALEQMADVCVTVPMESTPHVESVHLALEHLICDCLRQRISSS
ncbi:MAG: SIS domain-containing protein [Candidatus Latescibacteria bacterium]|jgi:D-sedoheptulose 7-phosphate isomerase|nr:SIS domain-containing protein [Candidatus Latescibacterota bacterium]MEE3041404.1 SIS domain-containing protein [Candidatus Latescibacterota bacterium]MEE3264523.1 SIS domain-containing protein [Candidatus Latescibacterota bacterium]|tara:strand:+ start:1004 stop:1603 length:600 start_codon:yes stop_codon:yes gene_type:complete